MNGQTEFELRVRQLLQDSADSLHGRTRSKLTQARHAALDQGAGSAVAGGLFWRRWAPAGAVAMALLVTVFYVGLREPGGQLGATVASNVTMDDLEMLADAEAYSLSADGEADLDAEFYEWAASHGEGGLGT